MTAPDSSRNIDRETRLEEVLARYLHALDSGEDIDPAQIIAANPDLADELRSFFHNRDSLRRLAGPLQAAAEMPTLGLSAAESVAPGTSIQYFGDYELLTEVARGGMGIVYKARQVNLNRIVALKMILAGRLADESDVKRFYAEAEAAARLDHPGIVPIFEIGQHAGQHYFSMAFVEGVSLAQRVAEGPLPAREAADIVRKVAEAVDSAHQMGIIHRDLKPANVLLDQFGQPRVTDFGLAKQLARDTGLTGTGQILGTPSYMPPEQAAGQVEAVGPAADVYSLGAILYCLLGGRPPFQAANPLDTLQQVLKEDPVPLRQLNPQVPLDLETIAQCCLEKEPGRRLGSARALADELGRFLVGDPIQSRPVPAAIRILKWCRRRPAFAALLLVSGVALAALGGLVVGARNYGQLQSALRNAQQQREFAEEAQREAQSAERNAQDQQRRAQEAELQARVSALQTRQFLHATDIGLAWQSWQSGRIDRMRVLLDRQRPAPGEPDLRGFEWAFLNRLGHAEKQTLNGRFPLVRRLAVTHEGTAIVSAHRTGTNREAGEVRRWKPGATPDSELLLQTESQFGEARIGANTVAQLADGSQLAVDDGTEIRILDVESRKERLRLRGHTDFIKALTFSPDGRRLASGSLDQTIRIWDLSTGAEVSKLEGHSLGVLALAFSPDGERLVSGGGDDRAPTWSQLQQGELKLWDPGSGTEIRSFGDNLALITAVTFAPDGGSIVSSSLAGNVTCWDASTGERRRQFGEQTSPVWDVTFSPGGGQLAAACDDGAIRTFQTETGALLATLRGHAGAVRCVTFQPATGDLVSGGADGVVKVWPGSGPSVRETLGPHSWTINTIAFPADSRTLVTGDYTSVRIFHAATGALQRVITPGHWIVSVALSNDGNLVAAGGTRGQDGSGPGWISLWDTVSGQLQGAFDPGVGHAVTVRLADNQQTLIALGRPSDDSLQPLSVWRWPERERLGLWNVVAAPVVTSDGHTLVLADAEGIRSVDLATGVERRLFASLASPVHVLRLSADGQVLAAGLEDGTLALGSLASEEAPTTWSAHDARIERIRFAPDGQTLVTVGPEETRIWDLNTRQLRAELLVPSGPLAITPDGRSLVTTRGMVTFWQLSTGQELLRLEGYQTLPATCVEVSPDGSILAEGGGSRDENDGVFVWRGTITSATSPSD